MPTNETQETVLLLGLPVKTGDFITVNGTAYEVMGARTFSGYGNILLRGKRSGWKILVQSYDDGPWEIRPMKGLLYGRTEVTGVTKAAAFVPKPNNRGGRY